MRYGAASSSVGRGNGRGFESRLAWSFLKIPSKEVGEIAKWPMATDRTSVLLIVRRFDSFSPHYEKRRIKFYPFKSNEKLSNKAPQPLLRVGAVIGDFSIVPKDKEFKFKKLCPYCQGSLWCICEAITPSPISE